MRKTSLFLIGAVVFCIFSAPLTFAQEPESEEVFDSSISSSKIEEGSSQEAPPVVAQYRLEDLLGDKVLGDFVLSPGKMELEIAPGDSAVVEITVSNRIGKEQRFDFEIEDMGGSKTGDRPVVLLGEDTGPHTLKDLISIPYMSFYLDHNKRAVIPVTITVPPDAEPGGRYGSVLVKTVAKEAVLADTETNTLPSSAVVSRLGILFFVRVPGEVRTEGVLREFGLIDEHWFYESGPLDFQILFENTGAVHVNPYGEVRITNMFDEEVGFVELEPWFVLPGALRSRVVTWNRDFLFGRYTATVHINRGYEDIVDTQSVSFWVIPWKLVGLVFISVFLFVFILRMAFRSFFRRFEFKRKN